MYIDEKKQRQRIVLNHIFNQSVIFTPYCGMQNQKTFKKKAQANSRLSNRELSID